MKIERYYEEDDWDRCRCGHPYLVHVHYRRGKDCGYCGYEGCEHFEPVKPLSWWREIIKNYKRGKRVV